MVNRAFIAGTALVLSAHATTACDIATPRELKLSAKKLKGWMAYDFTPDAMVDGKLLFRRVKQDGLPRGATEQKIVAEAVNTVFPAIYGGKTGRIKIATSAASTLNFRGGSAAIKQYEVELTQGADPTPKFVGVVIRENRAPKDLAVIVTPQDPDSPGEDVARMIGFAKKLAAHPGFDCAAGDMP